MIEASGNDTLCSDVNCGASARTQCLDCLQRFCDDHITRPIDGRIPTVPSFVDGRMEFVARPSALRLLWNEDARTLCTACRRAELMPVRDRFMAVYEPRFPLHGEDCVKDYFLLREWMLANYSYERGYVQVEDVGIQAEVERELAERIAATKSGLLEVEPAYFARRFARISLQRRHPAKAIQAGAFSSTAGWYVTSHFQIDVQGRWWQLHGSRWRERTFSQDSWKALIPELL